MISNTTKYNKYIIIFTNRKLLEGPLTIVFKKSMDHFKMIKHFCVVFSELYKKY